MNILQAVRQRFHSSPPRRFKHRPKNVQHKNETVQFDFEEEIELLVDENGVVERAEYKGNLKASIKISGNPVVRIGLNEPEVLEALQSHDPPVDLEILSFYDRVRSEARNNNQTFELIPPDDRFQLIEYRYVNPPTVFPMWVKAIEYIFPTHGKVSYRIEVKSLFDARSVHLKVPVMRDATGPAAVRIFQASSNYTRPRHSLRHDELTWHTDHFPADETFIFRVELNLPYGPEVPEPSPEPATLRFELPDGNVSGIKVMYTHYSDAGDFASPSTEAPFTVNYMTKNKSDGYKFKIERQWNDFSA